MSTPTPKKRLGQHFLVDTWVIQRIVDAIAPLPAQRMVEIGPGPGAITAPLIAALGHLHAVEVDPELAAHLRARFTSAQLSLHQEDALKFDFAQIGDSFRAVGNLPYNISTPLLFHLAGYADRLIDATFMLQKEVVDRMVALPGQPAWGRLSVMLQYRFDMQSLFDVAPQAFHPPPKVESAIVRMVPLGKDRPCARNEARFAALVMAGFGQRRKTLGNTLKPWLNPEAIRALGIDPMRRAETLSVAEFVVLADASASSA